ncbi:MAG TPA: MBG domain-containing protein, partial [Flavobacterium sp.]|nr:MBG domain-containing protein [Flavobacterium sp.]
MKTILPQSRFFLFVFLIANLFFANVSFGQATVTLDQADLDYAPGETVVITGTGWHSGETVALQVDNITDPNVDCGPVTPQPHELWTVVADENGNFTASWYVNDCELNTDLMLGALGQTSGFTYELFFTDSKPSSVVLTPSTNTILQGGSTAYTVNVGLNGNSDSCTVTLSASGLPAGASASFSGGSNPTTGSANFIRTLTINTTSGIATGTYTFTVTATDSNCQSGSGPVYGNGTLIVNTSCTSPTALTYTSNTATYCANVAIIANSPSNSGGTPTSYSVSPALPAGLSLNTSTGVISGTPTTATAATNYTVTATNSCGSTTKDISITVNTAPSISVEPSNITVTYGVNASFTVLASGTAPLTYQWQEDVAGGSVNFVNITNGGVYSGASSATLMLTGATVSMSGNRYRVVVSGACAPSATSDGNVTLTVNKASLTVTADDKGKTYGGADPALTYTPSGTLFYGDGYSVITGVNLSTATGAAATYGTHAITASNGAASNYDIVHVNGTLTVGKASLTVTADDKGKTYGGADPTLTYTPS